MLTEVAGRASEYAFVQRAASASRFRRGDIVRVPSSECMGECRVIATDPDHRKVMIMSDNGHALTLLDDEVEAVR
jgi:hypothetical protein